VRDSCGTSGQVRPLRAQSDKEAHRTPRGKGASGTKSTTFKRATKFTKTTFIFMNLRKIIKPMIVFLSEFSYNEFR
jgi:hypothetical protein